MPASHTLTAYSKLYNSLPYVIKKNYSQLYILPHKPKAPLTIPFRETIEVLKQEAAKNNILYNVEMIHKYKINVKEKFESIPNREQLHQQYHKEFEEYKQQRELYCEKYQKPIKIMNMNPFRYFISEQNKTQKFQQKSLAGSSFLASKWEKMSDQERQVYLQKVAEMKLQHAETIERFCNNHRILFPKRKNSLSLYNADCMIEQNRFEFDNPKVPFRQLSKEKREEYQKAVKSINQQQKIRFETFLKKWNLSRNELLNIIEVCKIYNKLKKNKKLEKKRKGNAKNEFDEMDESQDEDFQNLGEKSQH